MKIDSTLIASTVTELRGQPLRTGQTLAAIVLQANQATGKAVLSLAGGQVTVSTRQPLTTGSAIQLTVRDVGPPVVLGLTPSPAEGTAARASSQTPVQTLISLLMTRLSSSAMVSAPKADVTPAPGQQASTTSQSTPSTTNTPSTSSADSTAGKVPVGTAPIATATQSIKLDLPLNVRMALPNLDPVLTAARTGQLSGSTHPMPSGKPVEHTLAQNLNQLITTNSLPTSITNVPADQAASDIKSQLKLAAQQLKLQATLESPVTGKEPAAANRGAQPPSPAQSTAQSTTQTTSQVSTHVSAQANAPINAQASTSAALQSTPQTTHQAVPQNSTIQSSLEQWISRLDVSQLRTAIQQIQGQPTWVVDVPMMVAEQPRRFQIAIQEQHQNANQPAESTWQLDFAIELPELGPLHGSLSLQTTDLTVRMYADKPEARDQLNASLDQLAEHLRAASLTPKELSIYPGPPPKAVQERLNPEPSFDGNTTFRCQV